MPAPYLSPYLKMAPILLELKALNEKLPEDDFLGKGTLAVSEVFFTSPSRCAVADSCWISVDRRLTVGEDAGRAVEQIRSLPAVKAAGAEVTMYAYESPSIRVLSILATLTFRPG